MTWVQWAAIGFIVSVIASPLIGHLLYKLRVRREFRAHLARETRRARLEKLVLLADEHDAATTDAERKRVWIKASALGFCDYDDARPFALDDPPRRPAA